MSITIENIRLNNTENKTFLSFSDPITFEENTVYFVIGRSGVGKSSLVDFLANPFTNDPIKNGKITLGIKPENGKQQFTIKNSFSSNPYSKKQYLDYMRKSLAYIPQKTDSFHPAIPVVDQMYRYYKMARPKTKTEGPSWKEFKDLLEQLSEKAGWTSVTVKEKEKCKNRNRNRKCFCCKTLLLEDNRYYIDDDTTNNYPIIEKKVEKKYQGEMSSGQLQRLLILMGLIQFTVSDHPLLIGDEFLVNFTYLEANNVLKKIIEYFFEQKEKKQKIAIFILHDLSFDCIKNIKKIFNPDYKFKIIGIEDICERKTYNNTEAGKCQVFSKFKNVVSNLLETETRKRQKLIGHEITVADFNEKNWQGNSGAKFFEDFKNSYEGLALKCKLFIKHLENGYVHKLDIKRTYTDIEEGLYKSDINLDIGKNRVIVLTGFSGVGKSVLLKLFMDKNIKMTRKKTFRYFPDRSLSSLSEDSQIQVNKDLMLMYNYYNKARTLKECKEKIGQIKEKAHFYRGKETSDKDIDDFLNRKIYDFSGGELQRYWLVRLLMDYSAKNSDYIQPDLLILDESIASLDCITKDVLIADLLQEVFSDKDRNMTLFLVSHDLRDIGVIYKTLYDTLGNNAERRINDVFEHYEIINGKLHKVIEDSFTTFKENIDSEEGNRYLSLCCNKELKLKLKKYV